MSAPASPLTGDRRLHGRAPRAVRSRSRRAAGFCRPSSRCGNRPRSAAGRSATPSLPTSISSTSILAGGGGIETALDAGRRRRRTAGPSPPSARPSTGPGSPSRSPWDTFAEPRRRPRHRRATPSCAASVARRIPGRPHTSSSLAAKADTLRGHQVAETEAAAEAATERMTVPVAGPAPGLPVVHRLPASSPDHHRVSRPPALNQPHPSPTGEHLTVPPTQPLGLRRTTCCARLGIDPRDDRGLTTTEVAVITFLLVGAAIVVMGIIYAAAQNNANNIPDPPTPPQAAAPVAAVRGRADDLDQIAILVPAPSCSG
ncbi:MAG: hypothetical protein U5R31_16615 [Acidimicrobiia bacterium]|nr:hypothetical protein [Acidimicrobiia bacterium]